MTVNHEMHYRAETFGLRAAGIPDADAHWYCSCGGWLFIAHPNSTRMTGNNKDEALVSFRAHTLPPEALPEALDGDG